MNAQALLSHLRQCDVKVWLEGDRLRLNAPTGVLTPDLQVALTEHKSAIIDLLRAAESTTRATLPPIVPVQRIGDPPLSFGQQRLWFLDQLTPGTASYNIAFGTRLPMLVDTGVLVASLTDSFAGMKLCAPHLSPSRDSQCSALRHPRRFNCPSSISDRGRRSSTKLRPNARLRPRHNDRLT